MSAAILRTIGVSPAALTAAASIVYLVTTGSSAATTIAVHCPSQSINAAISAAFNGQGRPPVLDRLTINLTGTCTENVKTPPLREVWIIGLSGAILQPASPNTPAVEAHGGVTLKNLTVRSSLHTGGGLIEAGALAYLAIDSSVVTSTTANSLVRAFANSQLDVVNSTIAGGVEDAVEVSSSSHAFIFANGGKKTFIRDPGTTFGQSIGCWRGALTVYAEGAQSIVTIGPSKQGIASEGCDARLEAVSGAITRVTGTTAVGIHGNVGDSYVLAGATLTGNLGRAVVLTAGAMSIDGSTIGNNGSGIEARSSGVIVFRNFVGPSQITDSNDPYTCYQFGRIFSEPGYISSSIPEGACVQVGEPG